MSANKQSEEEAKNNPYGTSFSAESIKVMAEMIGIHNLSDDGAKELAEDCTIRVKEILQNAIKFMHHSKCTSLKSRHFDSAVRARGFEPTYGFLSRDFVPFRFASGGGRELHFIEENDIEFSEAIQSLSHARIPLNINIRPHWLVVDGIQPLIPENPPPLNREAQILEAVNPVLSLDQTVTKESAGKPSVGKKHKLRNAETVNVKQLATHELSVEQQVYYKEITEACVGSDESRRGEALASLAMDSGLHEMLPRMCIFISEGVKVNVVQNNLALLIYLMRMVKALLDNPTLYLEKYLHEITPSVITCIVSKQLCMRPELDNHWALRDFAARLMSQICKNFNTTTNNLQTRVTHIFMKALFGDNYPLSSLYGSIQALAELGVEVVKTILIPNLKLVSERIEVHLVGTTQSNTDKTAAGHIRAMIQKICPAVLRQTRSPPDYMDDYRQEFGFLGPSLCQAVTKLRNAPSGGQTSTNASTSNPNNAITSAAQTATGRPQTVQASRTTSTTTGAVQQQQQQPSSLTRAIQTHQQAQMRMQQQQQRTQSQQLQTTQLASASPSGASPLTLQSAQVVSVSRPSSNSPSAGVSPGTVISPHDTNPMSPAQLGDEPAPKVLITANRVMGRASPLLMRQSGPSPPTFSQGARAQGIRIIPATVTSARPMSPAWNTATTTQAMSPGWRQATSPIEAVDTSGASGSQVTATQPAGGWQKSLSPQVFYHETEANYQGMRMMPTTEDVILDETAEVPAPPELDDLSHLE